MKAAYIQGPSAFLEDTFRCNVEASLVTMEMAEFPVAIKQILLYIKSTVDNFGMVRAETSSSTNKVHAQIPQNVFRVSFPLYTQLSRDTGAPVLSALMGTLKDVVTKLQGFKEAGDSEPVAVSSQEGTDLFLDTSPSSAPETNNEQVGDKYLI